MMSRPGYSAQSTDEPADIDEAGARRGLDDSVQGRPRERRSVAGCSSGGIDFGRRVELARSGGGMPHASTRVTTGRTPRVPTNGYGESLVDRYGARPTVVDVSSRTCATSSSRSSARSTSPRRRIGDPDLARVASDRVAEQGRAAGRLAATSCSPGIAHIGLLVGEHDGRLRPVQRAVSSLRDALPESGGRLVDRLKRFVRSNEGPSWEALPSRISTSAVGTADSTDRVPGEMTGTRRRKVSTPSTHAVARSPVRAGLYRLQDISAGRDRVERPHRRRTPGCQRPVPSRVRRARIPPSGPCEGRLERASCSSGARSATVCRRSTSARRSAGSWADRVVAANELPTIRDRRAVGGGSRVWTVRHQRRDDAARRTLPRRHNPQRHSVVAAVLHDLAPPSWRATWRRSRNCRQPDASLGGARAAVSRAGAAVGPPCALTPPRAPKRARPSRELRPDES